MKPILLVLVMALAGVGGYAYFGKQSFVAYEKEIVVEVQTIDALDARVKAAVEAKSADTEALAQKAYEDTKRAENLKIEQSVTSEYRKELEAKEADLEEQLSF